MANRFNHDIRKENYMIINISALEYDGLAARTLSMHLEILCEIQSIEEVKTMVKSACEEYLQTEDGMKTYLHNCQNFNWADFEEYVPDEICRKHGFRKINSEMADLNVDLNEQIAEEPCILVTNIEWDTDEPVEDLPTETGIPVSALISSWENVNKYELAERISDYLSDEYGFLVSTFSV